MISPLSGSQQLYLANLNQTQNQMQTAEDQLSSGLQVQQPSDAPGAVTEILDLQSAIGQNQQLQTNLNSATTELGSADTALQSAVQQLQNAVSYGTQGASSTVSASTRANLAAQVGGVLQSLVGLSQTTVNGQYIFSGDNDTQPQYQLDPTQPNGVAQVSDSANTRTMVVGNGAPIAIAMTAQQIFDARDASGNPTSGNVFAAVSSLETALTNNNATGISQAITSLQSASATVSSALQFYGVAEDTITSATALAQKFQTTEQTQLGQLQDANIPAAALQLSQTQTDEQAALSSQAKIEQMQNLFSYLG
jgi:flagellar hook-associated protein 3 FlgL